MNGFAAANDAAVTFSLGSAGALAYSNSARHHHFVQHVTVIEPNEFMALPGEELARRSTGRELGRRPMQSEAFCDAVAASSKASYPARLGILIHGRQNKGLSPRIIVRCMCCSLFCAKCRLRRFLEAANHYNIRLLLPVGNMILLLD